MRMNRMTISLALLVALAIAGAAGFFLGARLKLAVPGQKMEAAAQKVLYYRCPMHPWITNPNPSTCPICAMDLTPVHEGQGEGSGIKIDPATAQTIGVTTEEALARTLTRDVRLAATVKADESREFSVTARAMGYAERLHVSTMGARVSKGQLLLEVYSPDLVSAQEEYLRALSGGDGVLAANSRQRLIGWGVAPEVVDSIEKTKSALRLVPLLSPASGVVADKMIVQGQSIMPGMQLYRISDLARVWAVGEAYQSDLALLRTGQTAQVAIDFMTGRTFTGAVSFVAPELSTESRTASVRVELANTDDWAVRVGMTATISIAATVATRAISIPEQAVLHSGLRDVIVVSPGNGYFEPRQVKLGASAGGYTQVLDGLKEHEVVVTSSQFLIDSESNLRAAVKRMAQASQGDTLHQHVEAEAASAGNSKPKAMGPQKTCPIMGGPINKKLFIDIDGHRIYVCCAGCFAQIKADPKAAIAVLAQRGETVERL